MCDQRRREPRPRNSQQRPQQPDLRQLDRRRHAGKTVRTASPSGAHGDRLGLVVCMVGDQQMKYAAPPASFTQQAVPRNSGGFLQAGARLGLGPPQDLGLAIVASQQGCRRRRFRRRLRPQCMIDDQADEAATARARPLVSQQCQSERITPAGYGDGNHGRALERRERRDQSFERSAIERSVVGRAHPQAFFWRSWSIRRFCRSVARG